MAVALDDEFQFVVEDEQAAGDAGEENERAEAQAEDAVDRPHDEIRAPAADALGGSEGRHRSADTGGPPRQKEKR